VATVALRAGEYVLGVRVNSVGSAALVRDLFTERHTPDANPPGNLSLWLEKPATGGPQPLHRFYQTYALALRSRSVRRMLDLLWHELEAFDDRCAPQHLLADVAVVIDEHGGAHLLNTRWRRAILHDERRWVRSGFRPVVRRWIRIDLSAGRIDVPASSLHWEGPSRAQVEALDLADRDVGADPAGSFRIVTWTVHPDELSLASRAMAAAGSLLDRTSHDGQGLVQETIRLLEGLGEVESGWIGLEGLQARLARLREG
jgi:hypothetical protein